MDDRARRGNPLGVQLTLPEEVREYLGLDEHESIRVVDAGARTILLERTGSTATATALPWDRDLVLCAEVRSFALADILELVHTTGKSGFLFFSWEDHAKSMYFNRGEVVFATSNLKVDRIGECLLRSGKISLDQLREAEESHVHKNRFGKVLVEKGYITPRELWNSLKEQAEEIVRSLFSYMSGTVYLWEGDVQPDNVVRLSLPTRRLVAEGLQRREELSHFLESLGDPRIHLVAMKGNEANLSGNERAMFDAMLSEPSFPALCRRVGLDPLSAARTLQVLRLVGAAKVEHSDDETHLNASARQEEILRNCVEDHAHLVEALAVPMGAVGEPEELRERFLKVVDEMSHRFPELLKGVSVGPRCNLNPEELLDRLATVSEDPVAYAVASLGELTAYLEFELKNHPRIEDPQRIFDELQDLRAKLEGYVH